MPITIKSASMNYRDPTSGDYVGVNAVSDTTTDIIAPAYADLTFPVAAGQHCIYQGEYYEANAAIQTSESWTAAHWTKLTVADEVTSIKSAITNKISEPSTEGTSGQVLTTDGNGGRSWTTPSGGGSVTDVQINGTSILSSGVANIPVASSSTFGAVKAGYDLEVKANDSKLYTVKAGIAHIKAGTETYNQIVPYNQHEAVYFGLSKLAGENLKNDTVTVGTYPEKSISAIHQMLDAPVSVSGSTPSITAKAGVRYICGEVSTLTIVVPASGIIDVLFESGSTPTVLTVTPPTGVTMMWANGFDPTSLEANTTYEVNIMDGCYGVVGTWA